MAKPQSRASIIAAREAEKVLAGGKDFGAVSLYNQNHGNDSQYPGKVYIKEEKLQFKTLENNTILMTAKEEVKEDRKEWQDLSENKGGTEPNLKGRILKY